ncbi:hypothetical protein FZEAL_3201 [Fusarium zealandicum]|uniref:Ankyrin n=1 Tax=Fusarium zealandicum TaxID=1053134 RepID=A0A8H4XN68_9HYPO|nr:hypothetical protein FZEAL_3201 [Fusarium zealandicum]
MTDSNIKSEVPKGLYGLPRETIAHVCTFLTPGELSQAAMVGPLSLVASWSLYYDPERCSKALTWGAYHDRLPTVLRALEMGADLQSSQTYHSKNEKILGGNPLHIAASAGSNSVIEVLLHRGSSVNDYSWRDAERLAPSGWYNESRTRRGLSPLFCALQWRHQHTVELLMSKGASLVLEEPDLSLPVSTSQQRRVNALHMAANSGMLSLIKTFVKDLHISVHSVDSKGNTPLLFAVSRSSNLDTVRYLLDSGANKDAIGFDGFSALHLAVKDLAEGEADQFVSMLLEAGVNADTSVTIPVGAYIETPLSSAVRRCSPNLILMMVNLGLEVRLDDLKHCVHVFTYSQKQGLEDTMRKAVHSIQCLLSRKHPEGADRLLLRQVEENKGDAAEILYSQGVVLPSMTPASLRQLFYLVSDVYPGGASNGSVEFMLKYFGGILQDGNAGQ